MPENEEQLEKKEKNIRWYVIHTYSGYENKVQDTLTRKVHSMGLEDTIKQILLPMQDEEEVKDGQKKVVSRKVFPGYLLIEMEVNDHSWYVVRNTPGVTGFVGTTTKPIPCPMTKWRAFFIKIKSPGEDHREGRGCHPHHRRAFRRSCGYRAQCSG